MLKHGRCEYQGCAIDLGMVPVARKYCNYHKAIVAREWRALRESQVYNRKERVDATHVSSANKNFINPPKYLKTLKDGAPCPKCQGRLHPERAVSEQGFTTEKFDLVCSRRLHRFAA